MIDNLTAYLYDSTPFRVFKIIYLFFCYQKEVCDLINLFV
jgi:hypothetical protein